MTDLEKLIPRLAREARKIGVEHVEHAIKVANFDLGCVPLDRTLKQVEWLANDWVKRRLKRVEVQGLANLLKSHATMAAMKEFEKRKWAALVALSAGASARDEAAREFGRDADTLH